jgi:hypothetical protein
MQAFRKSYSNEIKARQGQTPTHLVLTGGKWVIPDDLEHQFMVAYAKDIQHYCFDDAKDIRKLLCMTEVVTEAAPFFVDLDIVDKEGIEPPSAADIISMCASMVKGIAECIGNDTVLGDEVPFHSNKCYISGHRQALLPSTAVAMRAPSRAIVKQEVAYTKTGVHVIWPNFIVEKDSAKRLRSVIVTCLDESHPSRNWEDIVDVAVYRHMSSLRMIGSYKFTSCARCKAKDKERSLADQERSERSGVMNWVIKECEKSGKTRPKEITLKEAVAFLTAKKKTDLTMSQRNLVERYMKTVNSMVCPCYGYGRVPDVDAGAYHPILIMDKNGSLQEDLLQLALRDYTIAVHLCSVRRREETPLTPLSFPAHCPLPTPVNWKADTVTKAKADSEKDINYIHFEEEESRGFSSPKTAFQKEDILHPGIKNHVQKFLRSGAMGIEYSKIQVHQLYRLYNIKKKAPADIQNMDGTPYYSVIAAVKGYGSNFCHAINRGHNNNVIFFEFTPDQKCYQKCRSVRNNLCKKASKVVDNINFVVYVNLFPFTRKTVWVLPEEEAAWSAGLLANSYVQKYLKKKIYVSREGGFFKTLVHSGRKVRALNMKSINETAPSHKRIAPYDMESSSSAKKVRGTSDSGAEEDEEENMFDNWNEADPVTADP